LILGLVATWYARRGPVPSDRQRDFAITIQRLVIFEQPIRRVEEFQFLFRNERVHQVAEYRVIFANTGHEPIVKEDFDEPLRLRVEGETCKVYDCRPAVCRPYDLTLNVTLEADGKHIAVAPLLLNPGDFASFDFIVTNRPTNIRRAAGRIRGISTLRTLAPGTFDWFAVWFPIVLITMGLVVMTTPWWLELFGGDQLRVVRPSGVSDWPRYSLLPLGLVLFVGGSRLLRSWNTLREARYLGKGTERVFVLDDRPQD